MSPRLLVAFVPVLWIAIFSVSRAEEQVRIATYNIKFLNDNISTSRADQIKAVIASLDADIIGLEEIDDRAALERVFDPAEWTLVIDDDSSDSQDVAAAVRKPFKVLSPTSLNADDDDFLFPEPTENSNWPNRRDGLLVQIETPETKTRVNLIVVHAKARAGGRSNTDPRREGAARDLIAFLEDRIDDALYVVVGDMNDNPDDRSANILEAGDPNFLPGPEEIEGPFMFNLAEILLVDEHCSWGLSETAIVNGVLETRVPGSRLVNNATRDTTSDSISPILFDHVIVSPQLHERYVPGSIHVFDDPVAFASGEASDHVPVYADFVFDDDVPSPTPPAPGPPIQIVALLPDPEGIDAGNEWVKISNKGNAPIALADWRLRDRAGNAKELVDSIQADAELKVDLGAGELPLNNTGDDIELVDAGGVIVHRFSYTEVEVVPGQEIAASNLIAAVREESLIALRPLGDVAARAALDFDEPPPDALAIVSWNIQTGGTSTTAGAKRPPLVQRALGRILNGRYQLMAAQEIPSGPAGQLLAEFLPAGDSPWQMAFTDTTSRMDNGFWFQEIAQLGRNEVLFATEDEDTSQRPIVDPLRAVHPPHLAHFTVHDFDFTIITLHLTFHGGLAVESRREMQVVLEFLHEYFEAGNDPDVIICGDFNIPSVASGDDEDGITLDSIIQEDGRFEDPTRRLFVLVDEETSRSSLANGGTPARNYDHFIISSDCLEEFVAAARLPLTVLTDDAEDPEERLTSDHFPIAGFFKTTGEGVEQDVE